MHVAHAHVLGIGMSWGLWCAEEVDLAVLMGIGQLATAPAPPRVLLCGGTPAEPCAYPQQHTCL